MKKIFLLLFLTVLIGCSEESVRQPSEDIATQAENTPLEHKTLDDLFVDVNSILEGFGGMFYSDKTELSVYMTQPADEAEIRSAIGKVFSEDVFTNSYVNDKGDIVTEEVSINIVEGNYDAKSLQAWRVSLRDYVLNLEELVFLDLNEAKNVVNIGVTQLSVESEIREYLRDLEIPQEAVTISETAPIASTSTLQDRLFIDTNYNGGIEIGVGSGDKHCTLGFNVNFPSYGLGFITNSHCTEVEGGIHPSGNEPTSFYQSTVGEDFIGTERIDPPGFSGGGCQPGRVCRFSDSAFVEYTSGLSPTPSITLTNRQMGIFSGSFLDIHSTASVVADAPHYPLSGQLLSKVGRTTGHTGGHVRYNTSIPSNWASQSVIHSSCFDLAGPNNNFSNGPNAPSVPLTLYCQYEVNAWAACGDSGSPVYSMNGNQDVTIYGIVFAIVNPPASNLPCEQYPRNYVFSPIQGVEADLGSFSVTGF